MAQFKFIGEKNRPGLFKVGGSILKIRVNHLGEGKLEFEPPNGKAFSKGDVIEVEDSRAIRHLRVDPRFEEVSGVKNAQRHARVHVRH